MLRKLSLHEIELLYKSSITEDFPPAERRPLSIIKRLFKQNRYACFVLEEDNAIIAYASFICDDILPVLLLDYFAVDKSRRGSGIGSRFLSMLPAMWPGKQGILIECETPGTAKSEEEAQIRSRRIDFYRRGGAFITQLIWHAFSVDYHILYLPVDISITPEDDALARALQALYRLSLPGPLMALMTSLRKDT